MIFDGIQFKRTRTYGFRDGNPLLDKDLDGKPVPSNYAVIIRIDECRKFVDEKGVRRYDPTHAQQAFPLSYSLTYMGYGKTFRSKNKFGHKYVVTPVFLVWGGHVFRGRIKKREDK